MPIKLPNGTDWESPHVKVHLLYQAHFSRIQIPVDYLTDQRSILESCIRILQVHTDRYFWVVRMRRNRFTEN